MMHVELPQPGTEPAQPTVEAQRLNPWITRDIQEASIILAPKSHKDNARNMYGPVCIMDADPKIFDEY